MLNKELKQGGSVQDILLITIYFFQTQTFQYLCAKCWNNLSADMRNLTDVDSFNKSYKKLLLDSILTDNNYTVDNSFDKFYTAISTTRS